MYSLMMWITISLAFLSCWLVARLASPLSLAGVFLILVFFGSFLVYMLTSDILPYLLYLVYVGGLLVLMVYMVIISTNYQVVSLRLWGVAVMALISSLGGLLSYHVTYLHFLSVDNKSLMSTGTLEFSMSALILLVLLLLYIFMYVCESLRVGGRVLQVSKKY